VTVGKWGKHPSMLPATQVNSAWPSLHG